eukprot:767183-Hanusia_phi.AAC.1
MERTTHSCSTFASLGSDRTVCTMGPSSLAICIECDKEKMMGSWKLRGEEFTQSRDPGVWMRSSGGRYLGILVDEDERVWNISISQVDNRKSNPTAML